MLVITRRSSFYDKFRSYTIYVNGEKYAKIGNNSKTEIDLPAGEYEIYLSIDWCKSNKLSINIEENQNIYLECYPRKKGKFPLKKIFSFLNNTDDYIVLDWDLTI